MRTRSRSLLVAAIATTTFACGGAPASRPTPASAPAASAPAATTATGRGSLFIVGGGPQPPALVERFVELAGGRGRARIVVFAMASADGRASGEEKAQELRALGAAAVNLFVTRDEADRDSVARLLDGATGVWFGGGDQARLTAALGGTKVEAAVRARYQAGAVIGGTSAGAAVMSTPMITGDERRPGGDRPPSDSGASAAAFTTIARDNVLTADGFGLIEGAIVDQHFVRRRRHNRLLSLVLERPPHLGVGIDESTALVVGPDGRWTVLGASVAVVYDARRSTVTSPASPVLGATGVMLHVLPAGSTFDPASGRASLPSEEQ